MGKGSQQAVRTAPEVHIGVSFLLNGYKWLRKTVYEKAEEDVKASAEDSCFKRISLRLYLDENHGHIIRCTAAHGNF